MIHKWLKMQAGARRRYGAARHYGCRLWALSCLLLGGAAAADDAKPGSSSMSLDTVGQTVLSTPDPLVGIASLDEARARSEHLGSPEAFIELVRRAAGQAKSTLVRAHSQFVFNRHLARTGHLSEAQAGDDALGLLHELWLLGPFENTGGSAWAAPLPHEQETFEPTQVFSGIGRDIQYQRIARDAREGTFSVDDYLEPSREMRATLLVGLRSQREMRAVLRMGSTHPFVAMWNGEEVLRSKAHRSIHLDQSAAIVHIHRGLNWFSLRGGNADGPSSWLIRLTDEEGQPVTAVEPVMDPSEIAAAQQRKFPITRMRAPRPLFVQNPERMVAETFQSATATTVERLERAIQYERAMRTTDQRSRPTPLEEGIRKWINLLDAEALDTSGDPTLSQTVGIRMAQAHRYLGHELESADPTTARHHYETALRYDPHDVDAWLGLAALRTEQGFVEEARAAYRAALSARSTSVHARAAALSFERTYGMQAAMVERDTLALAEQFPTPQNLEAAADVALTHGDLARAMTYLERLLQYDVAHPSYARARQEQLQTLIATGGDEQALDELAERLRLRLAHHPSSHYLADHLAKLYVSQGRLPDALELLAERRARFPGRREPWRLAVDLSLMQGDKEAALEALQAAMNIAPQDRSLKELQRALIDEGEGLVAKYGVDVQALLSTPAADGAEAVGAEVLASTLAVRFYRNGLAQMVHDQVFRVWDPLKAKGLSTFTIGYSGGRESLDVLIAERVQTTGKRQAARNVMEQESNGKQGGMYTDARAKTILFGELQRGDVIHVRTRKELVGQQNLFGDFFGLLETIQKPYPVSNWRLVVEGPKDRPLVWGGRRHPVPLVAEDDDYRVYDFRVDASPRIEGEPNMPPWLEDASYVSVSTYDGWSAMGKWYASLIRDQLLLDDDLKQRAHQLVAHTTDVEERVRILYEFVVESTRYVGIELGIHGWKPYPVTEVFRRRYGDCKDKASLLVSLLQEVGIEARIVLVRTANLGALESVPASMWAFNHAIAYVPALDLFLDGTAERSGYRELPALDQGALALIVAPDGSDEDSRLVTIPIQSAEQNYNESSYVLDLSKDGTLKVTGVERFRGVHNADRRAELQDPATRTQVIERTLAQVLPGAVIQDVGVSDLSLSAREVSYSFTAIVPNRALRSADGRLQMPVSLYPHDLSGSYARTSERQHDIWTQYPWRTQNVMRYRLAPGMRVVDLPGGGEVEGPFLKFRQRITKTDDGFVVDEDTRMLQRRIPAQEYRSFRRAALDADELMKQKIRIEVTGGTP